MDATNSKPVRTGDDTLAGRAEVVLLTVDGADFRRVGVEAVNGLLTLSGEVNTESERKQAASVVRKVDGVHDVNNKLLVTHDAASRSADLAAETGLRSGKTLKGVRAAKPYGRKIPAQIVEIGKGAL